MLQIRPEHVQALQQSLRNQQRQDAISDILADLREMAPEALKQYSAEEQRRRVEDILNACERLGIGNAAYILNWCYISFLTKLRFYESDQFADILEHPFLHPDAKGRHIVLAFFAIERMARERR